MRSPTGAAPLAKGLACSRCKARKTRCSGEKPACAACLRSARFKHKPLDKVVCHYAEPVEEIVPTVSLVNEPLETSQSRKVPKLTLEDRAASGSSILTTSSVASTSSSASRPSFASSISSFQSFGSFQSGYDTDATSLHSPSVDSFKVAVASSSSNIYTPFNNPLAPPPPLSNVSPHYSPLGTPELNALTTGLATELSFYSPGLSLPNMPPRLQLGANSTLSSRRLNAPKIISIPNQTLFDPSIPQSAPPTLGTFTTAQEAEAQKNISVPFPEPNLSFATQAPSFALPSQPHASIVSSRDDFNLPPPGIAAYDFNEGLALPTPLREAMDDVDRMFLPSKTGLTPTIMSTTMGVGYTPWSSWTPARSPGWSNFS